MGNLHSNNREGFLGLGGSSSSMNIRNENNTLVVNKSSLDAFTENINENITNVQMEGAKKCGSLNEIKNMINFDNADVEGDFVVDGADLSQEALTSFHCIQNSEFNNAITSNILNAIMQDFTNITDNDIQNQLSNAAQQAASSGFGGFGSSSSNTNITNINNYESLTEDHKKIHNITKNIMQNNVSMIDDQECLNKLQMTQGISAEGISVSGDVNISNFKSSQVLNSVSKCIQETTFTNKVVSELMNTLGVKVINDVSNSVTNETENDVKQDTRTDGIGDAVGDAASGIGDGVGNAASGIGDGIGNVAAGIGEAFGNLLGGGLGAICATLCASLALPMIVCCSLLCCILLIFVLISSLGGSSNNNPGYNDYDMYGGSSITSSISNSLLNIDLSATSN